MRPYLTVIGYSKKYGVPESTVKHWIRTGKLYARKSERPMLIPDDQGVPMKLTEKERWMWTNR